MSDDDGVKVDRDYLGDTLGRFNVDFLFDDDYSIIFLAMEFDLVV